MTFAENINRLCKEKGTTLTSVVKKLGLSTSKVSRWNEGALPKQDVMLMLAHELQCSVMDFFADEEDLRNPIDAGLDEDETEIVRIFRTFDRRAKHEFMSRMYEFDKHYRSEGDKGSSVGSA